MSDQKILLMLYPGCISFETMLAVEILGRSFQADVVTTNDQTHQDASGLQILPKLSVAEVTVEAYAALLVPGGNPDQIVGDGRIQSLIREFHTAGKVIGGICAGVLVLADAGILKGESITHNYTAKFAPEQVVEFTKHFWADAIYQEALCVQSGQIVTAMPNGSIDFAITLATMLEVCSAEKAERLKKYYQGAPVN